MVSGSVFGCYRFRASCVGSRSTALVRAQTFGMQGLIINPETLSPSVTIRKPYGFMVKIDMCPSFLKARAPHMN